MNQFEFSEIDITESRMLKARKADLSSSLGIMVKQANEVSIHTSLGIPEKIDLRHLEEVKNYRALLKGGLQTLVDGVGSELDGAQFFGGQLLGGIIAFEKVEKAIEDSEDKAA